MFFFRWAWAGVAESILKKLLKRKPKTPKVVKKQKAYNCPRGTQTESELYRNTDSSPWGVHELSTEASSGDSTLHCILPYTPKSPNSFLPPSPQNPSRQRCPHQPNAAGLATPKRLEWSASSHPKSRSRPITCCTPPVRLLTMPRRRCLRKSSLVLWFWLCRRRRLLVRRPRGRWTNSLINATFASKSFLTTPMCSCTGEASSRSFCCLNC